jgi:hypothetical protein
MKGFRLGLPNGLAMSAASVDVAGNVPFFPQRRTRNRRRLRSRIVHRRTIIIPRSYHHNAPLRPRPLNRMPHDRIRPTRSQAEIQNATLIQRSARSPS